MRQAYRRWVCGVLAALLALLAACGAIVYIVDPCLYYRLPERWQPVLFNERYQMAGYARNVEADTVLVGTSMTANYRAGWVEEAFGTSAVRITLPDGYYSEFDQIMELLFRARHRERVIFAVDLNILIRDESGLTGAMPEYLYNDTPLDDLQYLLNKDALYYSAYTILSNLRGRGSSIDEGFTWDQGIWWDHMTALDHYERAPASDTVLPADAYAANAAANLAVIEKWAAEHPETEFDIFLSPYSILFWDKADRQGTTAAMLSVIRQTAETLLPYGNVKLYGFLMDREITADLDNYCDYIHHSGDVCRRVLAMLAADEGRLTAENLEETLASWRAFVVHFDYEKFWDIDFWRQWARDRD